MSRSTLAAAAALLLAAALTGCGGGGGTGPKLEALQADPLADFRPAGARSVGGSADPETDGGLLGKPREARTERLYAVSDPDAAFADAVRAAQAAGWSVDSEGDSVATLSKRLASGRATATITLLRDAAGLPDGVDPPVLSVALIHH